MAKAQSYRSAVTGRYVLAPATKSKSVTVREAQGLAYKISKSKGGTSLVKGKYATQKPKPTKEGTYRSAISGRFVTAEFGSKHPRTTVKETSGKRKG